MKQLSPWTMLGIWAAFCLGAGLFASWQGYGGRAFAATLTAFSFLLLMELLFAARGVADGLAETLGAGSGVLLGACVFVIYMVYLLGTGTFELTKAATMAVLVFVPIGLALWSNGAAAGTWQDFLTLAGIWVLVKFGPTHWLWSYPQGAKLGYVFTVMVAVNTAIASFLLVRRAKGIGYSIGWGNRWTFYVLSSFVVFACVAIPLAISMHFIAFAPQWRNWTSYIGLSVAIFMFTAWPEELLFRGLLQNFLSRASKSEMAGWWTASMLFGFSHITNLGFPNWRYVFLASIAGLCYGWTWRRTGSIFASALVHAGVDATWHFFFRTT
jgi:membrane protease YdiL (CAAX protease family)